MALILALLVGPLAAGQVRAATYYVRSSGDEANDGLTPQTARASVRQTARLLHEPGSLADLATGFNLNRDTYEASIAAPSTDFAADPRFVSPAGLDGVLWQRRLCRRRFPSARRRASESGIDAGSAPAVDLEISGSAVAGLDRDEGIVDLGYHYGANE